MKTQQPLPPPATLLKSPTGIAGLDAMLGGQGVVFPCKRTLLRADPEIINHKS